MPAAAPLKAFLRSFSIVNSRPYVFPRSRELYGRATRSIPAGVNSGIRKMEQPVPLYFERGRGSRLWDVDGNEYLDFQIGQGALLFGHAPPGLAAALAKQAALGTHWAAQSELEIDVAERLQRMVPSGEFIRFNNSATEVVFAALRLARAHLGRRLVLRFEGHYHGWGDEGLVGFANPPDRWGTEEDPARLHPSQGIIEEVCERFVVVPWNKPELLRRAVEKHRENLAAIIFEPVLCNTGCMEPTNGMLPLIRELCDRNGIVMIADETITGLRFGASSAQGYYGVTPDLTILGKAVGGGVPFAALAGRKPFFDKIISGQVVHAGTLNGNPLCLAASKWCLDTIQELGPSHPARIRALGMRLMSGLRALADEFEIPLRPQGPGLVFHTLMLKPGAAAGAVTNYREYIQQQDAARWTHLRTCLLEQGVRAIERGLWFISLAHDEADIEEALERARPAFLAHATGYRAAA
jgi:glutamate-1-semialdehyde 2,1-aminomutase